MKLYLIDNTNSDDKTFGDTFNPYISLDQAKRIVENMCVCDEVESDEECPGWIESGEGCWEYGDLGIFVTEKDINGNVSVGDKVYVELNFDTDEITLHKEERFDEPDENLIVVEKCVL